MPKRDVEQIEQLWTDVCTLLNEADRDLAWGNPAVDHANWRSLMKYRMRGIVATEALTAVARWHPDLADEAHELKVEIGAAIFGLREEQVVRLAS